MGHRRVVGLTLAAATLVASSCGGSSGSSTPLTHAELVAKADAICKRVNTRLNSSEIDNPKELGQIIPQLATYAQSGLAELTKLNPPANLVNDWKQIVAGLRMITENLVKYGEYAKSNNLNGARSLLTASETTQQQVSAIAERDGFSDCARTT